MCHENKAIAPSASETPPHRRRPHSHPDLVSPCRFMMYYLRWKDRWKSFWFQAVCQSEGTRRRL
ncbi:hypothetical protein HanPI659440_Chr03g0112651 [Helianthus annuus]|nr:hypothetical protein HanPI659440_Chr03g0112651 [Helianthus annuus]